MLLAVLRTFAQIYMLSEHFQRWQQHSTLLNYFFRRETGRKYVHSTSSLRGDIKKTILYRDRKNKSPISKSSVSTIKVPSFDPFPQCPCKGQYHSPSQAIGVTAFNHLISGLLVICMNVHMSVSQPMTYREDNFYGFSALHD